MTELKDSGARRQFESGAVRDVVEGKGRCDLLPLKVCSNILNSNISKKTLSNVEEYQNTNDIEYLYKILKSDRENEIANMLLDVALQYEAGAKKYADNNWRKGIDVKWYLDSGVRHYLKHLRGDNDEPHARAFFWNILGAIWTHENLPHLQSYRSKESI